MATGRVTAQVRPPRQEALRPTRQPVVLTEPAEGLHDVREARPAKAAKAAVLESADHRLVYTTQQLELPLRYPKSVATATIQLTDQLEAADRSRVHVPYGERLPFHGSTMAAATYRAITCSPASASLGNSSARARFDSFSSMHIECITVARTAAPGPARAVPELWPWRSWLELDPGRSAVELETGRSVTTVPTVSDRMAAAAKPLAMHSSCISGGRSYWRQARSGRKTLEGCNELAVCDTLAGSN